MCEVNTSIKVDAKRFNIPNWQLVELDVEFHRQHGYDVNPKNLIDLLEVVT